MRMSCRMEKRMKEDNEGDFYTRHSNGRCYCMTAKVQLNCRRPPPPAKHSVVTNRSAHLLSNALNNFTQMTYFTHTLDAVTSTHVIEWCSCLAVCVGVVLESKALPPQAQQLPLQATLSSSTPERAPPPPTEGDDNLYKVLLEYSTSVHDGAVWMQQLGSMIEVLRS